MSALHLAPVPAQEPDSEALTSFREWRVAVDAAAALRDAMKGRRIRFVGMFRNAAHQPTGRIKDVTSAGFKVLWDGSTQTEWTDPDSVLFIP
ncbi:hypothetical protein [Arthrobacter sp. PsM3]|uniref:hypothetical protein n=1 Tax=Arthrobacter sp. PsM3 TaxID=3030531 RepID=UPI00263A7FA4|nr:hypothetical protein [Arthrobacter sp. PsM3]MDN4646121.1 hypothetical protein [Arthrobacter sp. PsM3]